MLLMLFAITAAPYLAGIAAAFLLWRGLRTAGLDLRPGVLVVIALLILSPLLLTQGTLSRVLSYQLHLSYGILLLPMIAACLVGFALFRVLRVAGLASNKAAGFGLAAAAALLVAAAVDYLANAAIVGGHAFG